MTSDPAVVEALNASVAAHLTAIETYADLAACHDRIGFPKLADHWRGEVTDERTHLDRLLKRLEYLDAEEVWTHEPPAETDEDPVDSLRSVLLLEESAAEIERAGILTARSVGDEGTAAVFATNLTASEDSIYELRAWLDAIPIVTRANWLANWT